MAALQVGATVIPVAPDGFDQEIDEGTDRSRAIDGTMHVTVLGADKRSWPFRTPPITRASADTIDAALAVKTAQSCLGDILGGTVSCYTRRTGWKGLVVRGGHRVVLSFLLEEA